MPTRRPPSTSTQRHVGLIALAAEVLVFSVSWWRAVNLSASLNFQLRGGFGRAGQAPPRSGADSEYLRKSTIFDRGGWILNLARVFLHVSDLSFASSSCKSTSKLLLQGAYVRRPRVHGHRTCAPEKGARGCWGSCVDCLQISPHVLISLNAHYVLELPS